MLRDTLKLQFIVLQLLSCKDYNYFNGTLIQAEEINCEKKYFDTIFVLVSQTSCETWKLLCDMKLRVLDQNCIYISSLYKMLEIYHSGPEPSKYVQVFCFVFFPKQPTIVGLQFKIFGQKLVPNTLQHHWSMFTHSFTSEKFSFSSNHHEAVYIMSQKWCTVWESKPHTHVLHTVNNLGTYIIICLSTVHLLDECVHGDKACFRNKM